MWVLLASPEYWTMQLSPGISRPLGRRCKEEKENKALSRCQCCSGLAKIRCKTSSRLGARSCVSQRGRHPLSPSCVDHTSARWLSRALQLPKTFAHQPTRAGRKPVKPLASSCSAKHGCFPAASQRGSPLAWLSCTPKAHPALPLPSNTFRVPCLADLHRYPSIQLIKIFGDDSLRVCGSHGSY